MKRAAGGAAVGLAGCIGEETGPDQETPDEDAPDNDEETERDENAEYEVQVGTSAGGTWDVGRAFESAVNEHSDLVAYSSVESPGYVETAYRLDEGLFDGGIVDTNTMTKARDQRDTFEDDPVDVLPWQGFFAFPYGIYVMARDGTAIETFDDLAGANVYPAQPGYSTRATTLDVWSQEPTRDVFEEMNIMDMDVDDAPGAMEEEQIDAAIAYGTPGVGNTGWVVEYDARVDVHYVEHTDALVQSAEEYPGVGATLHDDPGVFQWQQDIDADEIFSWDLEVTFTFHPDTAEEAVYELARVAVEHGDTVHEAEERFTPENAEDLATAAIEDYPWHPGAAQFLQDEGVWEDDWVVGEESGEHVED